VDDAGGARGYFVTLTAPGQDVLPFDRTLCNHSAGVKCSGEIGCLVEADALAIWHAGLALRWSHFMTDLRDVLKVDVQFFKTWELQRRGALHAHAMLRVVGIVTDRRFRAAVRMLSKRYGFGPELDVQQVDLSCSREVAKRAGYCAKYASKSADQLATVRRLDVTTGEVLCGGFRAWSSSRRWGETMCGVKARRRAWAVSVGASAPALHDAAAPGAAGGLDLYPDFYGEASGGAVSTPIASGAASV